MCGAEGEAETLRQKDRGTTILRKVEIVHTEGATCRKAGNLSGKQAEAQSVFLRRFVPCFFVQFVTKRSCTHDYYPEEAH